MFYYIFVFITTTLLGFVYDGYNKNYPLNHKNKPKNSWTLIIILLIFIVFVGCRSYTVGADTEAYVAKLREASSMGLRDYLSLNLYVEPLFNSFLWACIKLVNNPSFFFVISTIAYFIVFIRFAFKYSSSMAWSIWLINSLGFTTMALSTVRQSLAISLCLLSYMFAERNKVKSWLCFIFAIGTHISSIIYLPMMFVGYLKKKNLPNYIIVIILAALFAGPMIIGKMAFEYESVTGKYGEEIIINQQVGGIGMIVFLSFLLIMGFVSRHSVKKHNVLPYANEMFAVGLALAVFIISRVNVAVIRLYWYYLPFAILYIPNVLISIQPSKRVIWKFGVIIITLYYLINQVMANPYDYSRMLLPYSFFWE